jgi:hypothetical protein
MCTNNSEGSYRWLEVVDHDLRCQYERLKDSSSQAQLYVKIDEGEREEENMREKEVKRETPAS